MKKMEINIKNRLTFFAGFGIIKHAAENGGTQDQKDLEKIKKVVDKVEAAW